jgi:hypothetical protein
MEKDAENYSNINMFPKKINISNPGPPAPKAGIIPLDH